MVVDTSPTTPSNEVHAVDEPADASADEPSKSDEAREQAQNEVEGQINTLRDEVRALYRRLHIELPLERRSSLIVELLADERVEHQMLGFELADRDLSASAALSPEVGQAVRALIVSSAPKIRAQSARLITRLVPPDAMIVLTKALETETHREAAEPMLLGVARWPSKEARASVLRWTQQENAPVYACLSAAWSLEKEGLLDSENDYPILLDAMRNAPPRQMREDGMKLLALIGSADDQRRLVEFMLSEDAGVVRWAASALVETPRAVEVLEQAARENEVFYLPAAESLIQHRATPDGLRRLSELPQTDAGIRRDMILRMGTKIDREQLGEAVRLARLEPELTIEVLSTLVGNESPHTSRSTKSVLTLAELQLRAGRPNRVIEALLSLEGAPVDPGDKSTLGMLKAQAMLLLSRFDEASTISMDFDTWMGAIEIASDSSLQTKIANEFMTSAGESLEDEQKHVLRQYTSVEASPTEDTASTDESTDSETED